MSDISYIESSNHLAAKEVLWRVSVGRFILAFASVEWFTFHMLSELPTERIFESVMSLPFERRLDLVTQLLQQKPLESALLGEANRALEQARQLAKTRNLIAHNPLLLNLFDDRVGVDLEYQISKYGETEARLTIAELQELCAEVERLDATLSVIRQQIEDSLAP
jgi:hypothetical protein